MRTLTDEIDLFGEVTDDSETMEIDFIMDKSLSKPDKFMLPLGSKVRSSLRCPIKFNLATIIDRFWSDTMVMYRLNIDGRDMSSLFSNKDLNIIL
ncbi:MAG TPA: hypothetical protein PL124_08970 [Candidatus Cloacimonadota bacterium]|nr:hypothetical protein [Candidatus Cloacimonadota bacterium]